MSFLIHLLLFSILPYFSASSYTYGIIRNASIKIPFDIPNNLSHQLTVEKCNECLCDAFRNSDKVDLFTCTQNAVKNFTCQFYYFMPKRDEIEYPRNDTNIYVIKDKIFEEKDDCCNTTFLIQKINNATRETNFIDKSLRFLVEGDNNTIVTISYDENVYKFDRSTLQILNQSTAPSSSSTIGYCDKKYYLNDGNSIKVFDETLTSSIYSIELGVNPLTTIRCLSANQILIGTESNGGYICERNNVTENFAGENCKPIDGTDQQVHAFGVVNDNAFYVGWDAPGKNIHLYTKDKGNSWKNSENGTITQNAPTSDIFVDKCKRVWATNANTDEIFIYDQNKTNPYTIKVNDKVFNFLILENYTLVMSHGSADGLSRIQPSINCRPLYLKDNKYIFG